MAPNPDIRASDADRDRVAANLREHCAVGRITVEEMNERLDLVYQAKTLGHLQAVTHDLPEEDLHQLPVPAGQGNSTASVAPRQSGGELYRRGGRAMWGAWAMVSGINFTIWLVIALTGNVVYPWWLWVAGPWGALILLSSLLGPKRHG
ncbi:MULTISPECIES: DUF1707 SHOCT-like domain-containing protein [Actinomadura]|uniref:DUF1707 domain-containing protein n=1 Tax=Actinomadura litoris TaxID=2678616 RepID=A0A7K1L8H6_9ACTN|nr:MULTISPECIES: DUF1707 domain-containing protein [Actinomadura]MBT2210406.1 DUF1707 domain-containing protein [Actinomadura sp. NEAU-AAG7]MUN40603.1 DUF1707 domain-containing protein [Actinomadura litoris]